MAFISKNNPNTESVGADIRDSGLLSVGNVPWGTHFCQFYQTKKDLSEILIKYFKAGLENNEFCVWVTSEFLTKDEALQQLKKQIPNFNKYLNKGQIEIFPYTQWYLDKGKFDLNRVLAMWMAKHNEGLSKGFSGLRVSGNPFWIDNKKDWDDFAAYEAQINNSIGNKKFLVLCTYSLAKCDAGEIIDVITNHQFAIIKRKGKWELIESVERKKAREALNIEHSKLVAVVENMGVGVVLTDVTGNISFMNTAALKLHGFKSLKEMFATIDQYAKEFRLFYPDGRIMQIGQWPLKRALDGEFVKDYEVVVKNDTKNLDCVWNYTAVPIKNSEGEVVWIVLNIQDITERKQLEQKKDEFIGVATHELKTPVTSIKAYTQLLYKNFLDKKDSVAAEKIGKMGMQVDRLVTLITDLLDVTKIQTGKLKFNKEYFDFNEMIIKIVDEVQLISTRHKFQMDLDESIKIFGDKERIGQVITNFLTNAIIYSPASDKVIIKSVVNKNEAMLFVQDFGIGIPQDEREKVFERFYQVKRKGFSVPTGLGLGLHICSEIIKRHEGKIGVESKEGYGSTFYFHLPIGK